MIFFCNNNSLIISVLLFDACSKIQRVIKSGELQIINGTNLLTGSENNVISYYSKVDRYKQCHLSRSSSKLVNCFNLVFSVSSQLLCL